MKRAIALVVAMVLALTFTSFACAEEVNDMPMYTGNGEYPGVGVIENGLIIETDAEASVYVYLNVYGNAIPVDAGTWAQDAGTGKLSLSFEKGEDVVVEGDSFVYVNREPGGPLQPMEVTMTIIPANVPNGNRMMYSVSKTETVDSPLKGKKLFWLGSSVTQGFAAMGESMADFMDRRDGTISVKEAVSGTTLADVDFDTPYGVLESYVKRLEKHIASENRAVALDAFICQLSTNDTHDPSMIGTLTAADVFDKESFDKATTFGAIEYIIALARETWDCPVVFYTNAWYDNDDYATLVRGLHEAEQKWGITVIDLYNDEAFNDIDESRRVLYMADEVHPTRAGYRDWWLVKFEETLTALLCE